MLVGNHCELRPPQRQVSVRDGELLAEKLSCGFIEASARHNENVSQAFEGMIAEIEKGQDPTEYANSMCRLM